MKRNIRKPRSNRYSKNYKPDLDYILEHLDNSQSYTEYIVENLDKAQDYTEYIAENIDNIQSYTEYIAEALNVRDDITHKLGVIEEAFQRRYSPNQNYNRRGFKILSKGNDYIILESDGRNSHWISRDDTLIDEDNMEHTIKSYNIMPNGLYLFLDGHLKLKEKEILYVK